MSVREAYIVAGPNGAGKTTLALEMAEELGVPYVGADDIAFRLSPGDPARARVEAGRRFFAEIDRLAADGASFVCESTLSGRGVVGVLRRLREAGYRVTIQYVFLDSAAVCLVRVSERVQRGGHDVPAGDVIRRFGRSKRNFWELYRPLADEWTLDYNGADGFRRAAAGTREGFGVYDAELFDLFYHDLAPDG